MSSIASDIAKWLLATRQLPGYYRYSRHAYRPYSAESSAAAACIRWELGAISGLSAPERQAHIEALQSFQAPDGTFRDPLATEEDRINKAHSWVKINEHISGACEQGLAVLGARPLRPNSTPPIFDITQLDPDEWIRSLDHREVPWGRCHNVAFSLLWYRRTRELWETTDAKAQRVYELIETEMLNPADGMPGATDHSIGRRIAGYYMLTFCYLPFGRPLPKPEAAIDLILKAVTPEGEIGEGGMCQNWDALFVLNYICRQGQWRYRHAEVVRLAETVADFLLRVHRKVDGGFSFHRDHCIQEHNHVRVAPARPESDSVGTLMALGCLNIAAALRGRRAHNGFIDCYHKKNRGEPGDQAQHHRSAPLKESRVASVKIN